jgi:hypothetical protein
MPRNQKRQLKRLLLVQPRIAIRRVIQAEVFLFQSFTAAYAFGDCVAGEFEVNATKERSVFFVDFECGREFVEYAAELASLYAGGRGKCVSASRLDWTRTSTCESGKERAYPCIGSHCQTTT